MSEIYDYNPLFNGWKIRDYLGKGGFGEVYSISREQLGLTQVSAVKRINISNDSLEKDPKLLGRVETEIDVMLKMKGSAYIVEIEEFSVEERKDGNGQDVLIRMELLDCIESIIEKRPLEVSEVVKLGIHICRTLELCDKFTVIHRDIRPPNIFRSSHGIYKLGDFGIAKIAVEADAPTYASTDDYMAPEMRVGKYDKRADIYSLGLTLFFLLNGNKLPFESQNILNKVRVIDIKPIPFLQNVPEWLSIIVQKACAHSPNERYANAIEMRDALEKGEINNS